MQRGRRTALKREIILRGDLKVPRDESTRETRRYYRWDTIIRERANWSLRRTFGTDCGDLGSVGPSDFSARRKSRERWGGG